MLHTFGKFPKISFPTEQTIIILLFTTLSLSFELNNPTKPKTYETISYNGSDQIYLRNKQRATKTKLCSTHSNESSSFLLHPNHVYLHEVLHTLQQHAVHCVSAMRFFTSPPSCVRIHSNGWTEGSFRGSFWKKR